MRLAAFAIFLFAAVACAAPPQSTLPAKDAPVCKCIPGMGGGQGTCGLYTCPANGGAGPCSCTKLAKAPPQSTLKTPLCECKACGCDGCECKGGKCLCPACSLLTYDTGRILAADAKQFLVTYVGAKPHNYTGHDFIVCYAPTLNGFEAGDVVISGPWPDGRHVWYRTLKNPGWYTVINALAKAERELKEAQAPKARPVSFAPSAPVICTT